MVNYKTGMVGAIVVALILAGALAYTATITPRVQEVTVTQTVTTTAERIVTSTVTVEKPAVAELKKVTISTLAPPSTSSWITFIIEELELDKKHGLDIEFVMQPSVRALYTDFPAGKYKVSTGGMLTFARMRLEGVPIKIFVTYQLFGTTVVVNTERAPDVKTLKDLEGKLVAGPLAAENLKAMQIYMKLLGVDLDKIKFQNFGHAATATELRSPTGRAVAGIMWAQLPSILELEEPKKFKAITSVAELENVWKEKTGTRHHWLLGFAIWEDLLKEDPDLAQRIYETFRDAVGFMRDFPDETIKIVSEKTKIPENVLWDATEKGRLKFLVKPAHTESDDIFKLYNIAVEMGFLDKLPPKDILYTGITP